MRFNAKKNQDHFEVSVDESSSLPVTFESTYFNNNNSNTQSLTNGRVTPVDVLTVDKYSRITLTRNIKKVMTIEPLDKLIVYKDNYSKHVIFQVQRGKDEIISIWNLTKMREKSKFRSNTGMNKKLDDDDQREEVSENHNRGSKYRSLSYIDTLYKIPIILIDDDQDMLSSYEILLRSEGYSNLIKFSDSSSSLSHIFDPKCSTYYQLAIVDIRMPNINGIKIYQILRIVNPTIKVLFVTGLDAADELTSIYPEIGPTHIIKKPFTRDEFIGTVNTAVSNMN